MQTIEGELMGNPNPSISDLNNKAIKRLYDLLDSLDVDNAEAILAVTTSISKLNSSLRGGGILPQEETAEERAIRERTAMVGDMLRDQDLIEKTEQTPNRKE